MILVISVKSAAWLLLVVMMWNYSILVTVDMRIGTYSELGGAGLCDVHLRNRYAQNFKKDFKLHVKRELI